jgi:uncharacterized membrane protein
LHRLRPVAFAALVASAARRTFEEALRAAAEPDAPDLLSAPYQPSSGPKLTVCSRRAGSIQAIDAKGLVRWARKNDCLLVLPHVVGDFLPRGAAMIEVYGEAAKLAGAERRLHGMVALGVERTIAQDPAFAIRIMADVAVRALSAAVNDPTTAVQVLDHLGETLRLVGTTDLEGPPGRREEPAPGRVVMRTRRWEDFLALGVTEIREYGATAIQVNRRLRAMLEELRDEVRPEHRAAVDDELAQLDASVTRHFGVSPDLDRAGTSDRQGIGGPLGAPTTIRMAE